MEIHSQSIPQRISLQIQFSETSPASLSTVQLTLYFKVQQAVFRVSHAVLTEFHVSSLHTPLLQMQTSMY